MHLRTVHRSALAAWLALLPACGSGNGDPDDGKLPPLGLQSKKIVDAICETQFECPIPNDDQLLNVAFFEQRSGDALDNCRAYYSDSRTAQVLERFQQAEDRGSLEVNQSLLGGLTSCDVPREHDPWLIGKVPVGQACQLHAECDGGYCDTAASCPGTCVARRAAGAQCEDSWQCLSRECDGQCIDQQFQTGAREGQPCASDGSAVILCAQGLWCDESSDTCRKPIAAGETCDDDDDVCTTGHFCVPITPDDGSEERPHRCLPLQVQALGGACDRNFVPGDHVRVCDLLHIDSCVDGTCVHYPEGHAGDPCNRTDLGNTCAAGFRCDGSTSVCVALLEDGASCSGSSECLGRCNFETGRCVSAEPYCEEPL